MSSVAAWSWAGGNEGATRGHVTGVYEPPCAHRARPRWPRGVERARPLRMPAHWTRQSALAMPPRTRAAGRPQIGGLLRIADLAPTSFAGTRPTSFLTIAWPRWPVAPVTMIKEIPIFGRDLRQQRRQLEPLKGAPLSPMSPEVFLDTVDLVTKPNSSASILRPLVMQAGQWPGSLKPLIDRPEIGQSTQHPELFH